MSHENNLKHEKIEGRKLKANFTEARRKEIYEAFKRDYDKKSSKHTANTLNLSPTSYSNTKKTQWWNMMLLNDIVDFLESHNLKFGQVPSWKNFERIVKRNNPNITHQEMFFYCLEAVRLEVQFDQDGVLEKVVELLKVMRRR